MFGFNIILFWQRGFLLRNRDNDMFLDFRANIFCGECATNYSAMLVPMLVESVETT